MSISWHSQPGFPSRDRIAWIEPCYDQFMWMFGRAMTAPDYDFAATLLAPWLQSVLGPDELRDQYEQRTREHAIGSGFEFVWDRGVWPDNCAILSPLEDLSSIPITNEGHARSLPRQITEANFRKALHVGLSPSDQSPFYDGEIWAQYFVVLVAMDEETTDVLGRFRIGCLELEQPPYFRL